MRSARRGFLVGVIGAIGVGALLALTVIDCAEATQIEVDIRTDTCTSVKNTAIAVGASENVETAPYTIFGPRANGCEARPADRIGTVVLYPSGAKDAEVAVRIVAGVTR